MEIEEGERAALDLVFGAPPAMAGREVAFEQRADIGGKDVIEELRGLDHKSIRNQCLSRADRES